MEGVTGSIPVAPTIVSTELSPTNCRAMAHPRRWLLAAVALLAVAGGAAWVWGLSVDIGAGDIEARISGLGIWAPVGFVLLYTVATVAMIPGSIFDLIGGALFGPYLGSVLNLTGGSLGAALAFLVGRYIARDWVERRAGPRLQSVMASVDAEGWQFVAFVRLVPFFPYNIMNYLLGVTRIPFHHYVLATVLCMAPATVAYTWIGHAGRELMAGDTEKIRYGLIGLGVLAVVSVLPRFFKRLRRRA
jgi:uncharacterized membrane protein YdjX (TVP38/TMEM64 family)